MLNPFVCGTFHHEEEDEPCFISPGSSPKKSKRNSFCKSHSRGSKNDDNPYSTRGRDKFSALLADLDEKRQKIYSQMSPQDISFVRFVSSNTDDFVPIVVKVRNKDQKHKSEELKVTRHVPSNSEAMDKPAIESTMEERKQSKLESDKKAEKNKRKSFSWNIKWRHPSLYLPVAMILILVFLTVFGRSAATLCTSIAWYIIPTLKDSSVSRSRKSTKKKDYVRALSENKMVSDGLSSPRSGNSGVSKDKSSPRKHGHQKSW